MADTQTTVETEQRQTRGVGPDQGVEVFDTNGTASPNPHTAASDRAGLDDPGFGHADLHNAAVVRGDATAADFRSTDLRHSELNSAHDSDAIQSDLGTNVQGTNWGTILMVIALILLIILVGSWLF